MKLVDNLMGLYKNNGVSDELEEQIRQFKAKGFRVPPRKLLKSEEQIQGIRKSAEINTALLDYIAQNIRGGMSTQEIDRFVYDFTVDHGAIPAPLHYEGFPKSVCTSVNDEVCHGIPSDKVILKEGDIVNVDVSTILDGYFSDASRMFMIGNVSDNARRLVETAKVCLQKGVEAVKPWGFVGDIGAAVQQYAESNGYSVVRDFGGHGVGLKFHEDPFISHVGKKGKGMMLVPGMIFTIEPMINEGKYDVFVDEDNDWTVLTEDGSLSAQWEHTVLVTQTGVEILTY